MKKNLLMIKARAKNATKLAASRKKYDTEQQKAENTATYLLVFFLQKFWVLQFIAHQEGFFNISLMQNGQRAGSSVGIGLFQVPYLLSGIISYLGNLRVCHALCLFSRVVSRVFHITPFFELSLVLLTTKALVLYEFTKKISALQTKN